MQFVDDVGAEALPEIREMLWLPSMTLSFEKNRSQNTYPDDLAGELKQDEKVPNKFILHDYRRKKTKSWISKTRNEAIKKAKEKIVYSKSEELHMFFSCNWKGYCKCANANVEEPMVSDGDRIFMFELMPEPDDLGMAYFKHFTETPDKIPLKISSKIIGYLHVNADKEYTMGEFRNYTQKKWTGGSEGESIERTVREIAQSCFDVIRVFAYDGTNNFKETIQGMFKK
jgi:hypothetical protein